MVLVCYLQRIDHFVLCQAEQCVAINFVLIEISAVLVEY